MNDQRSLQDQLKDLVDMANKNGMYDAADFLKTFLPIPPCENEMRYDHE